MMGAMERPADEAYELLDAGQGRRLERFGALLVDRPAPGATEGRRGGADWSRAVAFRGGLGWVGVDGAMAPRGPIRVRLAQSNTPLMLADLTAGGQVGIFPEHARNADWVCDAVSRRAHGDGGGPEGGGELPPVLNLFAYTGLLTLVAAAAGAAVTHVDASRPSVAWARRNAAANGLEERPIRWIVDDALRFLRREARRERSYDGLILDPPSYGHGREGGHAAAFRFERDIEELLAAALEVAAPDAFWLISTHTVGWEAERLTAALAWTLGVRPRQVEGLPLGIEAASGARLALGAAARFDPLAGEPR